MKRIVDSRLGACPPLYGGKKGMELRMNILTPLRFSVAKEMLLCPLTMLWQWTASLLLIDLALTLAGVWSVFPMLPVGRGAVYLSIAGLFLLWQCELLSGYSLTRFLFGRRMKLRVVDNQLWVMGRFRKKVYDLHHAPTFGIRPFELTQNEVYKRSLRLELNIQNTLRIPIVEVFCHGTAQIIVANANMLLHLATGSSERELDIDPTRAAL